MLPGWEAWRTKLPWYRGPRIVILPAIWVGAILVGVATQAGLAWYGVSRGRSLGWLEPVLPAVGTVVVLAAGFGFVREVWRRRDRYREAYGGTAYQRALPIGLVGIGLIFSAIVGGFVPVYQLGHSGLDHPLSRLLAAPLTGSGASGWVVRAGLALGALGLGALHAVRSVRTLGVDTAALVALYYPEESSHEDHAIYSVVRHPIYTGWLLWMAGSALFRLSAYGLIDLLVFLAALVAWLRRVEEPELIERFGEGYREYRRSVPALVPRPGSFRAYFSFLRGGP